MGLSSDLISQFVKATNDTETPKKETTVYGTIVYDGKPYVKLDGSDLLTPISTTTDVEDGERVTVTIKNHTAIVTGNISSPSARTDTVKEMGSKITEFEIVIADKVSVKQLEAEVARIDNLVAENVTIRGELEATKADIGELEADNATIHGTLTAQDADIKRIDAEKVTADFVKANYAELDKVNALEGDFHDLEATYGEFRELTTDNFNAIDGQIENLKTEKLSAEQADLKYVNIDMANINQAWFDTFYAKSGIMQNVTISEGVVVKELIGVTLKGDLIEAGTLKADRLVVKGSDGKYYKLNTDFSAMPGVEPVEEDAIHGSILIAKSITAEKVSVNDLVAFGATIGGFHITGATDDTPGAIYSGAKADVNADSVRGIYLDSHGQMSIGDANNFLKYFKDQNGVYKLVVSAGSILLSSSNKNVEEAIAETNDKIDNLEIGSRNLIRNSESLIFRNYFFSGTLLSSHDGAGNVTITCGISAIDDGEGYVTISTPVNASSANGNVTLT